MLERIHLEIVEALSRTGSLTKAAEELFLTQSALTHSIKKLELLSGSVIWEKEGRGLRLTQAGDLILQSATRLLPQIRNIEDQLIAYGTGKIGKLIIGVECHPCFEWLVKIINSYLNTWPDVDLDVTRNFQFGGLEALVNHKINMLVSPDLIPHDNVTYIDIQDFKLQLMVSKDHKLANRDMVNPDDLKDEVLYTYPISKSRLDIFKLDVVPRKHIPVEATEIMVQLVSAGRGVSTFPDWLIDKFSEEFNVKGIPLTRRGIQKKLFLAVRKEDIQVPFINSFIEILQTFNEKN